MPVQELPTADGVTIKVTVQVAWQIGDPVAAVAITARPCMPPSSRRSVPPSPPRPWPRAGAAGRAWW